MLTCLFFFLQIKPIVIGLKKWAVCIVVFQCVNRIYRGDPISQLPSCRFAQPSVLNRQLDNADDEIQEVVDSNTTSEQNIGVVVASTSSSDDPAATTTEKKISCPICWDDEKTVSTILTLLSRRLYIYIKLNIFALCYTIILCWAFQKRKIFII